jgi:hypothetical protein
MTEEIPAGRAEPLIGAPELLERSFQRFKRVGWPLLGIGGVGAALTLASVMLPLCAASLYWAFSSGPSPLCWFLAGLVGVSAALWLTSWAQAAMVEAALDVSGEPVTVSRCYRASWPKVGAFSWVCVLFFCAAAGGLFLLVVPGVFVGVAWAFAPVVVVAEGVGGPKALARSFGYVRGRWLAVFLRLLLLGALTSAVSAIPVVGALAGAVAAPFVLLATVVLYEDLRRTAPSAPPAGDGWLLACLLGLVAPAFIGVRSALAIRDNWPQLQARGRALMESPPIDADTAEKLTRILSSGLTADNVTAAAQLLDQARQPQPPGVAVATMTAPGVPAPAGGPAPR